MARQLPQLPKLKMPNRFSSTVPISNSSKNILPSTMMRSRIDQIVEEETANSSFTIFNNEDGPSPSTSKLLTKQDFKGQPAGRRKSNGSLVHSIPKFTEVKPTERLTEVQKVLQNRILMRQQIKLQKQKSSCVKTEEINAQQSPRSLSNDIVSQNEEEELEEKSISCPAELLHSQTSYQIQSNRAIHKTDIVQSTPSIPLLQFETGKARTQYLNPPPFIPKLSEVSITPAAGEDLSNGRKRLLYDQQPTSTALDLSFKKRKVSSNAQGLNSALNRQSPELLEVSVDPETIYCGGRVSLNDQQQTTVPQEISLILTTADYESRGRPAGYIFCPNSSLYVHPSVLERIPKEITDVLLMIPTIAPSSINATNAHSNANSANLNRFSVENLLMPQSKTE